MSEDAALLEACGVRVREVDDLQEGVLWIERQRILMVDRNLGPDEREAAFCRVLGRALSDTIA